MSLEKCQISCLFLSMKDNISFLSMDYTSISFWATRRWFTIVPTVRDITWISFNYKIWCLMNISILWNLGLQQFITCWPIWRRNKSPAIYKHLCLAKVCRKSRSKASYILNLGTEWPSLSQYFNTQNSNYLKLMQQKIPS